MHLLVLLALSSAGAASRQAFSIHDDVLAFPQYSIHFLPDAVSELQAQSRMISNDRLDQPIKPDSSDSDVNVRPDTVTKLPQEYDILVIRGARHLCSIPQVDPSEELPANTTRSASDEATELVRANERGWELLQGLEGTCLYYWAGWWSYRYCHGSGVKQFHQQPIRPGLAPSPQQPIEDPSVPGFFLGTVQGTVERMSDESRAAVETDSKGLAFHRAIGRIETRGDTRYLFEELRGGDICDLTGHDRTIEVQFHCNPATRDVIAMIKEVATCAYVMVIETPRLCQDVAFAPPNTGTVHAIKCHPIISAVDGVEEQAEHAALAAEVASQFPDQPSQINAPMIGEIRIGAHDLIPAGKRIEKSAIVGGGRQEKYVETVADSKGHVLDGEQLKKLGLGDPKTVERLRKKLDQVAGEHGWKLDVVDTPQGREYRGVIDDSGGKSRGKGKDSDDDRGDVKRSRDGDQHGTSQELHQDHDQDEEEKGSEETYKTKDEL